MIRKDIIKEILSDFHERELKGIIRRDIAVPLGTGKIITLAGVRRSGKTYLLLDTVKQIVANGTPLQSIIYINFEDERLALQTDELDLILQAYREMYPNSDMNDCYFLFDEIQNVDGWEKFVRRIYDSISRNIYITGSNSRLLSSDIASSLRGRTIKTDVYPLSFREYIRFRDISPAMSTSAAKARINAAFADYLYYGGFPETLALDNQVRTATLQEYYNVLLYKDLIERYRIGNVSFLKYFLGRVIANLGNTTSINKIYNELKSQGYKTTKNILYDILDWTEAVCFNLKTEKFSYSVINRERSEKKYYLIDNGLLNALTFRFSADKGRLLENMVAVELFRRYSGNVFFYKEQKECDFVMFDRDKPVMLVQSCYDMNSPETAKREIDGAAAACKYFGMDSAFVVTYDNEKSYTVGGCKINTVPALKFLLKIYP